MSQLQNNYVFLRLWNSSLWDRYHCQRWILGCCLWFVVVPVLRVAVWQKNVTQGKRCKYVQRTRRHHSKTLKLRWHCLYLAWNSLLSRETWGRLNIIYSMTFQVQKPPLDALGFVLFNFYCLRCYTTGLHRGSDAVCHKTGMYSVAFLACRVFIMAQLTEFEKWPLLGSTNL